MTLLVHQQIHDLRAYQTVPFSGPVKLDAMESPYGIPSALQSDWLDVMRHIDVNRYPDPNATELKSRLRQVFQIPDAYEITLGNGSDELLQMIQLTVGGYGRTIIAPQPSFSMYEIIARYTRARFIGVDLDRQFQLPAPQWFEAVANNAPSCLFFAYPNNPTGQFFDARLIEQTASMTDALVVADEAYFAYSGRSMLSAMDNHDNLAVVRTLSKSGLAGLRLGYLVSHPQWAAQFEKLRMPYNVGVLNQACATFALDRWDTIGQGIDLVMRERTRLAAALQALPGLKVYASDTNFIMVKVLTKSATEVFEQLIANGVLVRNLSGMHPLLADHLRISVGSPQENDAVLAALTSALPAT